MQFPNHRRTEFPSYGTSTVKTVSPGVLVFLTDFELVGTHAIPNVWECTNSHNMEIFCRKPYHF